MKRENSFTCQIAAVGMVNALGTDSAAIFESLIAGLRSPLEARADIVPGSVVRVGEVREGLAEVPGRLHRYSSRNLQLALSALKPLSEDVVRLRDLCGDERIGVIVASSTSGIAEGEKAVAQKLQEGGLPGRYCYQQQEMGSVARSISSYFNLKGPSYCISTACSSSAKVFRSGMELLRGDICDAVIVGGVDSLCGLTLNGFGSLDLLSPDQTQPMSQNRAGINIGEGGCFMLLTRDEGGVRLLGVGEASDAYHISSPEPEGRGARDAMERALADANILADDLHYVNLHGTGTVHNDSMEATAVKAVVDGVACSSTKPYVGHMLGASGATEAGFCWLLLQDYLHSRSGTLRLPVHLFDGEVDSTIDSLQLVTEPEAIKAERAAFCLSNSFGFGGSNCSVVLGAFAEI